MEDHSLNSIDPAQHIQRQLLMTLRQDGEQGYQQIKPDGLEGNAYNYHLKMLKKAGLVDAAHGKYGLTSLGSLVADSFSQSKQRLVFRPHFYLYPLIVQNNKVLVYKPSRMPTKDYLTIPSGKLHSGESIEQGLQRELIRRNLHAEDYTWRPVCPVNIRYTRQSELVFHRPGILLIVNYPGELADAKTDSGESFWIDISESTTEKYLPILLAGLQILQGEAIEIIDSTYEI